METLWAYTLLSVGAVSLISLVGIFTLALNQERLKKIMLYLISFSAGALLGDAFIHIIPEIMAEGENPTALGLYVVAGVMLFFVLEKFIRWHQSHTAHDERVHAMVPLTIVGDALHNFLDGMAIAAAFLVSPPVGFATAVAVIFHEIPQEIGQFAILIHGGWSRMKALAYNFASALTALVGALLVLLLAANFENASSILLAFGASSFIYIAMSDLIPEIHKEESVGKSLAYLASMVVGIGVMAALLLLE